MTFVACPDPSCGQVAEVVDEWVAESTDGRLVHRTTLCLFRHRYMQLVNPEES